MKGHIKTSFGYIRRAPFQALAAISVLAVTFFVSTLLTLAIYASNQVLDYFETRPQVIAFLQDDATDSDVGLLKARLEGDERVKDVTLVTKDQALELYKDATSDNPLLGELVSPSIFPASLEFSAADLNLIEDVIAEIENEPAIESIGFTASLGGEASLGDVIERLRTLTLYVRIGGIAAVSILAAMSLIVLMVVIGMRITLRRSEIESLNLIGATAWFIRAPIVMEAFNYAVMGVIVGWTAASVLVLYGTPSILKYFGDVEVIPSDTGQFFALLGFILAGELLVGVIISLLASLTSVSRSLKSVK